MLGAKEARELFKKKITEKFENDLDKLIREAINKNQNSVVTGYYWEGEEGSVIRDILTEAGYSVSKSTQYNPYDGNINYIKISW